MKRGIVLTLALALVLVFALGTVAMAVPSGVVPSGGANDNPLGNERSTEVRQPFGEFQSAWVHEINAGDTEWANYGDFLNSWKADNGFK